VTTRERRVLLVLGALYAAFIVPTAVHKGPDLGDHLVLADSVLRGGEIYHSNPTLGVWWPPFAIVSLVPLALVAHGSLALAKGIYALLSVVGVFWSIARLSAPSWRATALAVAAVSVPLQANFEYLNMNAILLALVVGASLDLVHGRDTRAGVWIGLATALKLFPGLLLVFCAGRGRWRAGAVGAALALGLTALSLVAIGGSDAPGVGARWWSLSVAGAWLPHVGNQSVAALVARSGGTQGLARVIELALCLLVAAALRRPGHARDEIAADVGIVALLSVLLSPIAWGHAFVLLFPAWIAALANGRDSRTPARRGALLIAGIATSGLLMVLVSSYPFKMMLLRWSIYVWGGLLLLGVLLLERVRRTRSVVVA
jgi:alpha-1,2-mannosyltransferase